MNNKNKAYILVLFSLILSYSSASAFQMSWTNFMWSGFMWWAWNTMDSGVTTTSVDDTNSDENSQDSENSDDDSSAWANADVSTDLKFDKNWTIWANADVNWNVTADKDLKIGSSATINGNVVVNWNLDIWSSVEITWYVKVKWNLTIWANATINWTIYSYNKTTAWANSETHGKLKSAWLFTAWANYSWDGKLYAFWNKKFWAMAEFADAKEKWILGRLDAYLKIDISWDEFAAVKKLTTAYDEAFGKVLSELKKSKVTLSVTNSKLKLAKTEEDKASLNSEIATLNDKISSLRSEWKDLIEKLVIETEQYIETEEFDTKWVSVYLKNEELAKLDLEWVSTTPIKNNSDVKDKIETKQESPKGNDVLVNSSAKNEKLKWSIRVMLEKKLSKYDEDKKSKLYDVLLSKLDKMIENTDNLKTKNTLVLLKEVVQDMKDEVWTWSEIDNIFNSITWDSTTWETTTQSWSTTSGSWSTVSQ